MLAPLRLGELEPEQIDVRDQADRHALRERTDLHGVPAAAEKWKETAAEADERAKMIRNVAFGHVEIAIDTDTIDQTDARSGFVREERILRAPLGPEHLFDRLLKHSHPRLHRWIGIEWIRLERTDRVVQQIRRRGPHADERRRPDVPAAAGGQGVVHLLAADGMPDLDRTGRRHLFVRLGREVVPDVVANGVGRDRCARVDAEERDRHAQLGRQVVVFEEIGRGHDRPHLVLEVVGLRPSPVLAPCREVARAVRVFEIEAGWQRRQLARMAARTTLGEHDLAASECRGVFGEVTRAARRILQVMRLGAREEEPRHVRRLQFRRAPVIRIRLRGLDRDRRDRLAADDGTEVEQPLLAEQPDVDVDAVERAERADRIGSILEHARRPARARPDEELRERIAVRDELVELFVLQPAAGERLLAPLLREPHARQQVVHGVHRPRIIDVVGGDERRIERARARHVERLIEEAALVLQPAPVEDAIPPEVLRADVRAQVLPLRILGIGGRLDRVGTDVTERARHADAIRPHQIAVEVVGRIVVEAFRVPPLARALVERRIREQPEAGDTGGLAVVGADRQDRAARADFGAWISRRVGERIGRTARIADVEPQSVPVRIGSRRFLEARFVDEAEIRPAIVATVIVAVLRVSGIGMRRDRFQQIEGAEAVDRQPIPEGIVAAGPHDPHVAPFDLLLREGPVWLSVDEIEVHVLEVVVGRTRELLRRQAGAFRFVEDGSGLRLVRRATDESGSKKNRRTHRHPSRIHGATPAGEDWKSRARKARKHEKHER